MAYDSRTMKKDKKLMDCWTSYGKVLIKDLASKVIEMKSPSDLLKIWSCILIPQSESYKLVYIFNYGLRE